MDDTVLITIVGMVIAAIPSTIAAVTAAILAIRAKTAADRAAAFSRITKESVDGHTDQMMQNARTANLALGRVEALMTGPRRTPPHEEQV